MYRIILLVLFTSTNVLLISAKSVPVISAKSTAHMSDCEISLYRNCITNKEIQKKLTKDCDSIQILHCLKSHLEKLICAVNDAATIPTIRAVIKKIKRRFKRNKKCANRAFLQNIKQNFIVQGQGIEYTNELEFSGSGEYQDDSEGDDQPTDGTIGETEDGNKSFLKKQKEENEISKYWRENSKRIMKERKNVQLLVFFDDPSQYKKKVKVDPIQAAWDKLQNEYRRWYKKSKYYLGS